MKILNHSWKFWHFPWWSEDLIHSHKVYVKVSMRIILNKTRLETQIKKTKSNTSELKLKFQSYNVFDKESPQQR